MLEDLNPSLKKDQLQELSLFSHVSIPEIKKIFNALLLLVLCNYAQKKETYIPNIGSFKLTYDGDEIIKLKDFDKKKAKLNIDFNFDNELSRMIGQYENKEEIEIMNSINKMIKNLLELKMKQD